MTEETKRPLVLIADDDEDILQLVRVRLARTCDLVLARDGVEALAASREAKPDLALLDVAMPAMDGYEVASALKADAATKSIVVILLTARAQPGDVSKGLAAGADDYITKPFSPHALEKRVHEALASAPPPPDGGSLLGMIRPSAA